MEYCKEKLGTELWLAIRNPNKGLTECPYCNQKIKDVDDRTYILAEGTFLQIEYEDNILYLAEYFNPVTDRLERTVISHRYCDLEDEKEVLEMKDHSIFDLQYAYDEGNYAFATKEEAEEWLKEFGRI